MNRKNKFEVVQSHFVFFLIPFVAMLCSIPLIICLFIQEGPAPIHVTVIVIFAVMFFAFVAIFSLISMFNRTVITLDSDMKTVTVNKSNRLLRRNKSQTMKWQEVPRAEILPWRQGIYLTVWLVLPDHPMVYLESFVTRKEAEAFRDKVTAFLDT